jgi:Fe-S oxidoreductase
MAKLAVEMPRQRKIPAFAPRTFREWFRRRRRVNVKGPTVVLWPDTFNNYFLPDTSKAAVEVLEAAGFRVILPKAGLCCGRPLYDFGMLDRAKRLLLEILDALAGEIEAGTPIVVLEPSCAAVFRDELLGLFPSERRAQNLAKQTFLLSEFFERYARDLQFPRLERKALVHGHCHQKSTAKMTDEESVLRRLGVEFYSPAPGCCGMAGSFGFEADKYEVSVGVGELELLPAVREATADTLIIADGFSCREQIAQCTNRHALHLAEVIQMSLNGELDEAAAASIEAARAQSREDEVRRSMKRAAFVLGGVGLALWAFRVLRRK